MWNYAIFEHRQKTKFCHSWLEDKIVSRHNLWPSGLGLSSPGVPGFHNGTTGSYNELHPRILADQLNLSQPWGNRFCQPNNTSSPDFQTFLRPCGLTMRRFFKYVNCGWMLLEKKCPKWIINDLLRQPA